MAKITDFECTDETGHQILCDPNCAHPVLAIIRQNQRGAGPHNPAVCRRCGNVYWLTVDMDTRLLTLKTGG